MPREYTACVKSKIKSGTSAKHAKRICAARYHKKHGMTVKQAHKLGIEEIPEGTLLKGLLTEEELAIEDSVLLEYRSLLEVIEDEDDDLEGAPKRFRFKGVALVDNVLSANDRLYTAEFCDVLRKRTNKAIREGQIITIHGRHGRAFGAMFSLPTHMQIGRVDKLVREGDRTMYHATLAKTRDGVDAEELIRGRFMAYSSIRATDYEYEDVKLEDDRIIKKMLTAVLDGIDLAERPGIPGAAIVQVLEEAPVMTAIDSNGGNAMEIAWGEVTLEMLKENVAPLLTGYVKDRPTAEQLTAAATVAATAKEAQTTAESSLATALVDKTQAVTERDAAIGKLAPLVLAKAILQASHNPLTALVATKVGKKVTSIEDITDEIVQKAMEEARAEILVAAGIGGPVTPAVLPAGLVRGLESVGLQPWQREVLANC